MKRGAGHGLGKNQDTEAKVIRITCGSTALPTTPTASVRSTRGLVPRLRWYSQFLLELCLWVQCFFLKVARATRSLGLFSSCWSGIGWRTLESVAGGTSEGPVFLSLVAEEDSKGEGKGAGSSHWKRQRTNVHLSGSQVIWSRLRCHADNLIDLFHRCYPSAGNRIAQQRLPTSADLNLVA